MKMTKEDLVKALEQLNNAYMPYQDHSVVLKMLKIRYEEKDDTRSYYIG